MLTVQGICDETISIRDLLLETFQKGDRKEKSTSQKAAISLRFHQQSFFYILR
jgi:hypothetical protein